MVSSAVRDFFSALREAVAFAAGVRLLAAGTLDGSRFTVGSAGVLVLEDRFADEL